MARFIQSLSSEMFTSEIGDLDYSTLEMRAHFEISANFVVLCEIDAVASGPNNYVSIFGLGDILHNLLLNLKYTYAKFTITDTLQDVSVSVTAVRCDHNAGISFSSYNRRLFFSSDNLWIPSTGSFYFYCRANVVPVFSVTYADSAGVINNYKIKAWSYDTDGLFKISTFSIPGLMKYVPGAVKIVRVNIAVDSSELNVYVYDAPDVVGFRFENCFGHSDTIYFRAAPVPKLEVECSEADMGHSTVQYDFETSRYYEVSANSVKPRDWSRIQQFLQSRDIEEMSSGRKILISDISTDLGERYEKLGSVKFSYRYTDSRIPLTM